MTPYYEDGAGIVLYCGDAREVLPALGAVDVVITDPPYSEHVHGKSKRGGGGEKHSYGKTRDFGFVSLSPELRAHAAREFARLTRRWVLVFSDVEESLPLWRADLERAGLDYIRAGIWRKLGCTPQFTGDRPSSGIEAISIAHRPGRKRWNGGGGPAVWEAPVVNGGRDRVHTAQKPLALMLRLVGLFSDPGELVLDAFCGSGTTLVACKRLGRRAVGVDCDEASCESAAKRLSSEPVPLFLTEAPSLPAPTFDFEEARP